MSNSNLKGIRRNNAIRAPQVRVIDPEGKQLGVYTTSDALKLAAQYGVDLIEIAATANPPVCRIMDFGKYRYEMAKSEKGKNTTVTKLKEIKFRVKIEQNDYLTKLRHAEGFLMKNNKVKMVLAFRGREMGHTELGMEVIRRAIADLAEAATPDAAPKLAGRAITVMLSPLPTSKRKAKFSRADDEPVEDTDDEDESDE